jgi:branched-chain amino acid transport system ATP-binding protein
MEQRRLDRQGVLLQVRGVRRTFAGVVAVDDVSLEVAPGELVGVLGPNGAGKSTLFYLISGHLRPDRGGIWFAGRDVMRLPPYRRAQLGIGLVFQAPRLFAGMSVFENVMSGQFLRTRCSMLDSALRLPRHLRAERAMANATTTLLERFDLRDVAGAEVSSLPFGVQRRVAVAQALGVGTRLMLLDEPAAGLTGSERTALRDIIGSLRADGIAVLLVEHDVGFVSAIADTLVVLDRGAVLASGGVAEVLADPSVVAAYSGVSA